MTDFSRTRIVCAGFIILTALTAVVGIASASSTAPRLSFTSTEGAPLVVLRFDPQTYDLRVPPPRAFSQMRIQSALISIKFLPPGARDAAGTICYDWPAAAKTALNYAASIWSSLINSSVPMVVEACWADLGGGILGYGGTEDYFESGGVLYPAALANALSGTDLNGADVEMIVTYNRNFDWYFGTDGNTPGYQVDFVSVVLHEICHGLGFAGSMRVVGGRGFWGWGLGDPPTSYDTFTENGSGAALLSFPNGSEALAAQLTSNNVYFDGPNANAANGGSRPKLFAPGTWMQGSSYSHLDEIYNGTPNALMTYSMGSGESTHDPGPVAMGILEDVGWATPQDTPDLSISMAVVNGLDLDPGDPVTLTLSIGNEGTGLATGVVISDSVPEEILAPVWSASPSLGITLQPGPDFVWGAESLSPGTAGAITVSGTISPLLSPDFAIVNSASIWAHEPETNTDNNTVTVILGGERIYLPLVVAEGS